MSILGKLKKATVSTVTRLEKTLDATLRKLGLRNG